MKNIRKFLPLSIYDIPGTEQWLEEQANSGLFPLSLGSRAKFSPTGIPGTRFRLEPYGKIGTEPTEDQLELYRNAGWEYAFSIRSVYFLFYTTNPEATELYSDNQSRGLSLERLERRVRKYQRARLIIYLLLAAGIVLWALFFNQIRFGVQPDLFAKLSMILLHMSNPISITVLIVVVLAWGGERRDLLILSKTCQALGD